MFKNFVQCPLPTRMHAQVLLFMKINIRKIWDKNHHPFNLKFLIPYPVTIILMLSSGTFVKFFISLYQTLDVVKRAPHHSRLWGESGTFPWIPLKNIIYQHYYICCSLSILRPILDSPIFLVDNFTALVPHWATTSMGIHSECEYII